jgi:hypothetical protein
MLTVPDEWLALWKSRGTNHAVAQCEALPVLIAKLTWFDLLFEQSSVFYTDNEVVRYGLIKGASANYSTFDLLNCVAVVDCRLRSQSWVARVPSPSNPGDGPSRLDSSEAETVFGAKAVVPVLPFLAANGRFGVSVPLEPVVPAPPESDTSHPTVSQ